MLTQLERLPFTTRELRQEATARADKMSLGGVQPKVSAVLDVDANTGRGAFRVVDRDGRYLLKPATDHYPEVPANEDLSMRLARLAGVETPWHGLIRLQDDDLCYVIRRFDRLEDGGKLAMEDAGQLLGLDRDAKYDASMESLGDAIRSHVTLPAVEMAKLLRLVLVNYLLGNEDAHLRNFSILTRENGQVTLAPAYDVLNSTIALHEAKEEIALTVANAKSGLKQSDLLWYLAEERFRVPNRMVMNIRKTIEAVQVNWDAELDRSFLSAEMQLRYAAVLSARRAILFEERT